MHKVASVYQYILVHVYKLCENDMKCIEQETKGRYIIFKGRQRNKKIQQNKE